MALAAIDRAVAAFRERYGTTPSVVARAPGRVNLIGEHTDYNGGAVLPMALQFETAIAAELTDEPTVQATSEGLGSVDFRIADDPTDSTDWGRYLHGAASFLAESHAVSGWRGTIASDIPLGAGLSSSAALEVAAGLVATARADETPNPIELATAGMRVENDVLGLPSGIMDQLVSAAAAAGHACLIHCDTLSLQQVALPPDHVFVVMDTGTRRQLVDSEFANRRATCDALAQRLGVTWLSSAKPSDIENIDDPVERKRFRHVVSENQRTTEAAAALATGQVERFGELMIQSHGSLKNDYEVSSPGLDAVVAMALEGPGCLGARMTGGGFAGSAVAFVARESVETFVDRMQKNFRVPPEQPAVDRPRFYVADAGPGAELIR